MACGGICGEMACGGICGCARIYGASVGASARSEGSKKRAIISGISHVSHAAIASRRPTASPTAPSIDGSLVGRAGGGGGADGGGASACTFCGSLYGSGGCAPGARSRLALLHCASARRSACESRRRSELLRRERHLESYIYIYIYIYNILGTWQKWGCDIWVETENMLFWGVFYLGCAVGARLCGCSLRPQARQERGAKEERVVLGHVAEAHLAEHIVPHRTRRRWALQLVPAHRCLEYGNLGLLVEIGNTSGDKCEKVRV